jgi:hypothetical protein
MIRRLSFSLLLLVPACGGGGGGTVTPVGAPVRLQATALDLGPATSEAELVVRLADTTESPALMRLAVELPPALALAANDRLLPVALLPTLEGEAQGNRLLVLCGDARNPVAGSIPNGALFRVRLVAAVPRQVGTHQIKLVDLQASASDGSRLPVDGAPVLVPVTLR